jgi:hypothetical protein
VSEARCASKRDMSEVYQSLDEGASGLFALPGAAVLHLCALAGGSLGTEGGPVFATDHEVLE